MPASHVVAIGPFNDSERTALEADFEPVILSSPAELDSVSDAAAVSAVAYKGHSDFGAAQMDALPGLKLVANYGVGYDAIDVDAANARGIKVTNTPDVLSDDVADLAVGMLLAQGRDMMGASDWVRSGKWAGEGNYPLQRKLTGGSAGIVGLGRIGREIADRLAAFKMDIHYTSRSEKDTPGWTYHADPTSMATAVDYLIVALVGGPETEKLVSRSVLEALGPRGIVVNISRGSCVDEEAMIEMLGNGGLAGAGLDVFLDEPNVDPRFLAMPNVVLQPHQASATVETRAAMAQLQRDNIKALLAGTPLLTPVN